MLGTYSHNSLDTFENCPRRFKFSYVERVEVPERVSADLYLGNAVHRTLARLYDMASHGVLWKFDDMVTFYRAEWDKPERDQITVPKDFMTVDDYIRNGAEMLDTFYRKHQPFAQVKVLGIERDLHGSLPGTPYRLKGRIDRLSKRTDGVIEIVDYKTGGNLPRGGRDPQFMDQMGLYHVLVRENYPDFGEIELIQYYLKLDEVVRYRMSDEDVDLVIEKIKGIIREATRAEKLDEFPPKEGHVCTYCDYVKLCPAKRHRLILDNEAGTVDADEKRSSQTAAELAAQYIELDGRKKDLDAELTALKESIIKAARELHLTKLASPAGTVSVTLSTEEKFPTKSNDLQSFIELSSLVRQWQLDEALTVDMRALEELYENQRLAAEQIEALRPYVVVKESSRVTVRRPSKKNPDE
jgi:RecB family exonuclease